MQHTFLEEYGVEPTVAGSRTWTRIGSAERRSIASAGAYVGVCRRMRGTLAEAGIDGRLVAAGFGHVPPREWVRGETGMPPRLLEDFVSFWTRTQTRPDTIGSSYNAAPEVAFRLWQGRHWTFAITVPSEHWARALRPDGSLRRRWGRNCIEIGRALRRCSASTCGVPLSARAAAALGRLCPETQHAALQGVAARVEARISGLPCSSAAICGRPTQGHRQGDMPWAPLYRSSTGQYLDHGEGRSIVSHPCLDWPEMCQGTGSDLLEASGSFGGRVVRIRDLDWAAAERVQSVVQGGDRARLRMVYDRPMRFERLLSILAPDTIRSNRTAFLAPAYPRVDYDTALHLFLGMGPVQISGSVLSRREAHEWLLDGGRVSPVAWIVRGLPELPAIRSANIARWLVDLHRRGGWGGLTRTRIAHGPAEARLEFRMIDRIDEIQDVDLVRGISTSVEDAFRYASERLGADWLESAAGDYRVLAGLPARWRLYPCMRALVTPAALAREGREMGHCVGGYSYAVERGQSVILALNVAGHRSTAEVAPEGRVLQHRAINNGEPHPLCQTVLNRFVERRIG